MRKYSAAEKRKRDRKFRENLARRENPIFFCMALPVDVENLADISWRPTREERILDRLAEMKKEWDAQELAYYRRKHREHGEDVARDLPWLERQNELEAELTAIQTYFRGEREKELAAEDQARREKATLILKEINADISRFERAAARQPRPNSSSPFPVTHPS